MTGLAPPLPVVDESFPLRLRWARAFRGLTQFQLAERLGLGSITNIRNWEARGVEPGVSTLAEVARALNVPADYLVGLHENPEPSATRPFTVPGALVCGLTAALVSPDEAAQKAGLPAKRLEQLIRGDDTPSLEEVAKLQAIMEGEGISALTFAHRHVLAAAAEAGATTAIEGLPAENGEPPAQRRGRRVIPRREEPPT